MAQENGVPAEGDFFKRIEARAREKRTLLCIGLDPRVQAASFTQAAELLFQANKRLVDLTKDAALCYKPNCAFYEQYGTEGLEALKKTLDYIPDDIPVILDAKRGDIGPTAEAYAAAVFGQLGADAVTLSPYMGFDSIEPFLKYEGRGLFLLCRTSNPGAAQIQDQNVAAGGSTEPLYLNIAKACSRWSERVGLVVAGNDIQALTKVREALPEVWILAPGIGTQGGNAGEAVAAGARNDGLGILIMAARSVAEAEDPGAKARELRDTVNAALEKPRTIAVSSDLLKKNLLQSLIRNKCFEVGDFILKSGKRSPFYIDLRKTISDPLLLDMVGEAYASVIRGLDYDHIAGIPVAGLPLATVAAMKLGKSMVFPRMSVKGYGTGKRVEGSFEKGQKVLLLDDLITTGASKIEAVDILRADGLVVEDLVVLIERGSQGRRDMEQAEIRLHAYAHLDDLLAECRSMGMISASDFDRMKKWAEEN